MPTTYAVPNGRTAMAATTYSGTGANQSISNAVNGVSFQPDLVWVKTRSNTNNNNLQDSVRGVTALLQSNNTDAQGTVTVYVTSFNSNGFSLGADTFGGANYSGYTYVGWQWKAGGTPAVSNTAGSISSTVSANTTSGFSIVTYTGTSSVATVGHGLGVAPSMIIVKNRSSAGYNWPVYHSSLSSGYIVLLNTTDAQFAFGAFPSAPTSSVFSIGTWGGINASSDTYVAYCFAQVAGYSSFGKYTGNGSADGPFIYTGFRPAFIMVKASSGTSAATANWLILDTTRNPSNETNNKLAPNLTTAENSGTIGTSSQNNYDLLSNGFKARTTNGSSNENGTTFIYIAFAENPFKYANAR